MSIYSYKNKHWSTMLGKCITTLLLQTLYTFRHKILMKDVQLKLLLVITTLKFPLTKTYFAGKARQQMPLNCKLTFLISSFISLCQYDNISFFFFTQSQDSRHPNRFLILTLSGLRHSILSWVRILLGLPFKSLPFKKLKSNFGGKIL